MSNMKPDPNPQFSQTGELVTGTLRGYRSWKLRELPIMSTYQPAREERYIDRTEDDWFNEVTATFGSFPIRAISAELSTKTRYIPARYEVEPVLGAVSWNMFWAGPEIRADVCTYDPMWQQFLDSPMADRPSAATAEIAPGGTIRASQHRTPVPECTCGIYGWYTPEAALYEHTGDVVGVIEVSGRVLLGSTGFRAERAKIIAITMNPRAATVEKTRQFTKLGADGSRYHGVDRMSVFTGGIEALRRRYPPDTGTLRNLGIEIESELEPDDNWYAAGGWTSGSMSNRVTMTGRLLGSWPTDGKKFMLEIGGAGAEGEPELG
jgi:hypothetical protein